MQLQEAITLLQPPDFVEEEKQVWADLGCGSGLFTYALANLLPKESIIYAVDENPVVLKKIQSTGDIYIKAIQSNFITGNPGFLHLDGILMANSLHYVKDKPAFIEKMMNWMKPNHSFLIVEYNTDKPVSQWVPHPVSFQTLKKIFSKAGYPSIKKLNEHPSVYNTGNIYSAIISN